MFADSSNEGKKITVIMQDLNGLKQINDNRGHLAGDQAILAVATALKESCPENTPCVRAGGDELLAMIIGDYNIDQICNDIDKKLEAASEEIGFKVSASTGVYSTVYENGMEINKIIDKADERMYEMKRKIKKEASAL